MDEVENIWVLQHYGGIEEIYSCHSLDHSDRWSYKNVLRRWFEILKPGGMLRISTPDFASIVRQYQKTENLPALIGQLYAGQDYPDNVRHWIWDKGMAMADLTEAGFLDVKLYDPVEFFDQCGMPVGPYDCSIFKDEDGNYKSLNILARKPE